MNNYTLPHAPTRPPLDRQFISVIWPLLDPSQIDEQPIPVIWGLVGSRRGIGESGRGWGIGILKGARGLGVSLGVQEGVGIQKGWFLGGSWRFQRSLGSGALGGGFGLEGGLGSQGLGISKNPQHVYNNPKYLFF